VDDGKLVGLAVSSRERIPFLPDMPTIAETLPGYEVTTWYGLLLPQGTPIEIRDTLKAAVLKAVSMPETRRRLEEMGYVTRQSDTPEAFAKFLDEDIAAMAKLIRTYNLKAE